MSVIRNRRRRTNFWDLDVFSSSDLGVWLSLHPQASRQSQITIATGISAATDVSGNSRNLSQSTGNAQSAYLATGFNGFPAISMDGVDDFFAFSVPQSYNQVIMAVIDSTDIAPSDRIFLNRTFSAGEPGLYIGSGVFSYGASFFWGSYRAVQTVETRDKVIYFWQLGGNGTGFNKTDVNAQNLVSQANTNTSISSWNTINSGVGIQHSAIKLSEFAILENPSQDTIDRVYGIFAHRWWRLAGQAVPLPTNHPYYSSPPTR